VSTKSGPAELRVKNVYRKRRLGEIASRWDERAAGWDRGLQDPHCYLNEDNAYQRFLREAWRIIETRWEFCSRQGVIDAGCGTGFVLTELIPAFAWGVGVDISRKMIRFARAKRIRRARFVVSDCFSLRRVCPKAGAVVSRGVLLSHYGHNQGRQLLRSARLALAPGGFIFFDFLNLEAKLQHLHAPEDKLYFSRQQVQALAHEAGFPKVTIRGEEERRILLLLGELE